MRDVSRRHVLKMAGVLGMAAPTRGPRAARAGSRQTIWKAVKGARLFDLSFVWNEQSPENY